MLPARLKYYRELPNMNIFLLVNLILKCTEINILIVDFINIRK